MNSSLYSLFISYQNKEFDDAFINEAFELMMREENLHDYINDFIITEDSSSNLGTYSTEERKICFNKSSVLKNETIENKNLLALQVLRHEIEHARNLKRLYEQKNDIETKVIRYSLYQYAIKNNLYDSYHQSEFNYANSIIYQKELYSIDPGERIAEIKAWKYLVNLLKNQRRTKDLYIARVLLYFAYIRGYKTNKYYFEAPTYEYLLTLGLYHEYYFLKKQFNSMNYNLDTRLLCGLPISEKEYDEKTLKKARLKKIYRD